MMIYGDGVHIVVVHIYVNNILVIGSNATYVQEIISMLNDVFSLKDLGGLNYFLGIKLLELRMFSLELAEVYCSFP